MVNFCEHRIVTFSLKFVFRGHCIILKSYNQWGGRFSVGDEGGGASLVSGGSALLGSMGLDGKGSKKIMGIGETLVHKPEWCFWTIRTIWTI